MFVRHFPCSEFPLICTWNCKFVGVSNLQISFKKLKILKIVIVEIVFVYLVPDSSTAWMKKYLAGKTILSGLSPGPHTRVFFTSTICSLQFANWNNSIKKIHSLVNIELFRIYTKSNYKCDQLRICKKYLMHIPQIIIYY